MKAEATQEREKAINEFWKRIATNYSHRPCSECPATAGDDCGHWDGTCGHSLRKKYESIAGIPQKNAKEMVLPAPVTQVDGVDVSEWTVKQWLQKINEELDELKEVVLYEYNLENVMSDARVKVDVNDLVAAEASDVITAITSMLEAMGIDERQRQAAQRRVNERNKERDRL